MSTDPTDPTDSTEVFEGVELGLSGSGNRLNFASEEVIDACLKSTTLLFITPLNIEDFRLHALEIREHSPFQKALDFLEYFRTRKTDIARYIGAYGSEISQYANGVRKPSIRIVLAVHELIRVTLTDDILSPEEVSLRNFVLNGLEQMATGSIEGTSRVKVLNGDS